MKNLLAGALSGALICFCGPFGIAVVLLIAFIFCIRDLPPSPLAGDGEPTGHGEPNLLRRRR